MKITLFAMKWTILNRMNQFILLHVFHTHQNDNGNDGMKDGHRTWVRESEKENWIVIKNMYSKFYVWMAQFINTH